MRKMMMMMDQSQLAQMDSNYTFEINPNHHMVIGLNSLRKVDLPMANTMVRQLFDNTLLQAELLFDTKDFVIRVNKLMEISLNSALKSAALNSTKEAHREVVGDEFSSNRTREIVVEAEDDSQSILNEAYAQMKKNMQDDHKNPK